MFLVVEIISLFNNVNRVSYHAAPSSSTGPTAAPSFSRSDDGAAVSPVLDDGAAEGPVLDDGAAWLICSLLHPWTNDDTSSSYHNLES